MLVLSLTLYYVLVGCLVLKLAQVHYICLYINSNKQKHWPVYTFNKLRYLLSSTDLHIRYAMCCFLDQFLYCPHVVFFFKLSFGRPLHQLLVLQRHTTCNKRDITEYIKEKHKNLFPSFFFSFSFLDFVSMSIESYLSTQKQQQEPPVSLPPPLTPKPLRHSRLEPYLV